MLRVGHDPCALGMSAVLSMGMVLAHMPRGNQLTQFTSYWDRLPEELRQQIQWMADFQHAEERLFKGWNDVHELFDPCGHCALFKLYEGRVDTMGNLISKSPRMWWKVTMTPSAQCFHCCEWFHTRCMNLHVRSPDHPATSR
ncbi:hypothetical protein ACROYT_G036088 [Oculina patagonica]